MIPVKPQESSSRRSSILKPPKSRHPLQFVDFNSSPENSPTAKQTRRVSFAEKKHVKEFVDSVERGTLWDNTYEENEFGGGKFPCTSHYEDTAHVEDGNPMDEENHYSIHKVVGINENVQPNHLAQMETANTFIRQSTTGSFNNLYNNEDVLGSFPNECDISQEECDLDLTDAVAGIETTEVREQMNNSDNYTMHGQPHVYNNQAYKIETSKINKTVCHDVSMELTTAIPFRISSNPGLSEATCTTLTTEKQYSNPSGASCMEGTNIRSGVTRTNLENSINCENKTMEFTTAVTHENVLSQFILNKENINHLPYIEGNTEDSFMECTAAVDKTRRFENHSMILTQCIPSKFTLKSNPESTGKIYGNDDMDQLHQKKSSPILDFNKRNNAGMEKTKIFGDTSMEMTSAMQSVIGTRDFQKSNNRNETLGNMSMEITNVIAQAKSLIEADNTVDKMNRSAMHDNFNFAKNILINKMNIDPTISETTEKTRCFQNMSMELTTLVSRHAANDNLTENIKLPHKKRDYSEYVDYCQETSNKRTKEQLEATKILEEDKTKLFKDMSMEITTAIPLAVSMPQGRFAQNLDNSAVQQSLVEPVEEIIVTTGKEVRHNVNRITRNDDRELDTGSDMTKLFKNVSMEMTTVIHHAAPSVQQDVSSNFNDHKEHETPVEPKDKADVIEHQVITNTVNENIYDQMIGEPRKSIRIENTSQKEATELSESTIRLHENHTYNIRKPWIYENSSGAISKITSTEESKKKDIGNRSINDEEINENILLQNENIEITNRIPITGSAVAKNISISTQVCTDTNQTEQLSINSSPTKRTYVIRTGFCTQVNESAASDTDIAPDCEEACINKNISDCANILTYNNEHTVKDSSTLSENINAAQDTNEDIYNISVFGDEMYMIDIENRPTCLISNDSYEENNDNESHELTSEKIELTHCDENYERIKPSRIEGDTNLEASIISSHNDVPEDPFVTLTNSINNYSERDDCIWKVRCLNERIFAFDFISSSLVVVMMFEKDDNKTINNLQKINIISRLTDEAHPALRMVHRLILNTIDPESLIKTYFVPDDVLSLMEHISKDVIFAMDFMFEYKRLHSTEIIDIIQNRIQFNVWTKTMHAILNISIEIKPLDNINLNDVEVECVLGSIRVDDIKTLIVNAKKDQRYLTRCINDVKEYLTWMEETG